MNIKELGFDKLVRAFEQNENPEYIFGVIDTIEELFRLTATPKETKQEEAPEEVEEDKKAPAKKKPSAKKNSNKKKEFDMGKVRACRNAGWSWEKLGDEFSASTQTVINHVKKYNSQHPDNMIL